MQTSIALKRRFEVCVLTGVLGHETRIARLAISGLLCFPKADRCCGAPGCATRA